MSEVTAKKAPKVVINIKPGPAVSTGQSSAWKKFWRNLISETRREGKGNAE